jgi:ABC-type nitrate/sulfonate/bicarbonate transport system substrate-binding protein
VRRRALLVTLILLAGCGGSGAAGEYGDVTLSVGGPPGAEDAGVYLATARGYDTAEGVTLRVQRDGDAALRLLPRPTARYVAVMAIVRPAKLLLCADRDLLQDQRGAVAAAVRALQRGYAQAQLEPEEAVAAMADQVPGLDSAAVAARMDDVAPTWSAGAPFIGQLGPGPDRDPSVAKPLD